jgi:BON domain
MKIKLVVILAGLMALVIVFAACSGTDTGNNKANTNSNVNKSTPTPTPIPASGRWNSNISKEEYEKGKAGYEKDKTTTEKIGEGVNDSWLWFKTRSALATADDLRDSTIGVSVSDEVVTLSGTVANAAQKASAEKVAKAVTGVKSVKNELKVSATDSMTNQIVNGNTNARTNTNKK